MRHHSFVADIEVIGRRRYALLSKVNEMFFSKLKGTYDRMRKNKKQVYNFKCSSVALKMKRKLMP